jgi:hypothetical protein
MENLFLENEKHNVKDLMMSSNTLLHYNDDFDIFVFRRLLEAALKLGFWSGTVGMS